MPYCCIRTSCRQPDISVESNSWQYRRIHNFQYTKYCRSRLVFNGIYINFKYIEWCLKVLDALKIKCLVINKCTWYELFLYKIIVTWWYLQVWPFTQIHGEILITGEDYKRIQLHKYDGINSYEVICLFV